MTTNDAIVLQANFEEWQERVEDLRGVQPWLYYCIEQFVKVYELDDDEIQAGITDGGNDGGTDGFHFIVNQRLVVDDSTALDGKNVSKVRLLFFQVKSSGGFKPTEIDKWIGFANDFFDLSKSADSFGKRYSGRIVQKMRLWKEQYLRIAGSFPEIAIDYYYITAETAAPDSYALDSGERVRAVTAKHVQATCTFHYVGAQQLWRQVQRRPPRTLNLTWSENPLTTADGAYVGLVYLRDFAAFLQDEPGVLAERLFESNVRGYQPNSPVNKQIMDSLENGGTANFWLLNNGVTILTSRAVPTGTRGVSIEDPQIVNGLQTSREIFSYVAAGPRSGEARSVLVRVIPIADAAVQDQIIKSTNSQNKMAAASLRMTDQIHRNIEELFKKVDLFYDRRKGFWRDKGKPVSRILSVNTLAQAVISVILQRPDDARARPGDYFKEEERYSSIFGEDSIELPAYLTCVQLLNRVERLLEEKEVEPIDRRNLKYYVLALLAREVTGQFKPQPHALLDVDTAKIEAKLIESCYQRAMKAYTSLAIASDRDAVARGSDLLKRLNRGKRRKSTNGAKALKGEVR